MRYRFMFVVGLAVGYVLGTRAGRERYEQMRQAARQFVENPAVRNAYESAAQNGREAATRALDTVSERMGDRMPGAMSGKVRTLRERRTAPGDTWSTNGT